jgi:hypothetical protein
MALRPIVFSWNQDSEFRIQDSFQGLPRNFSIFWMEDCTASPVALHAMNDEKASDAPVAMLPRDLLSRIERNDPQVRFCNHAPSRS